MTADLTEAMLDFDRCIQERDGELAERTLDDDYALVLVVPAPAVMPRQRWLEVLPDYVVHEWVIEEQVVDVDDGLATVLSKVRMRATVLGEDRSGIFVVSDLWRRRDGHWRVWRRHSTPHSAGSLPGTPD